MTFLQSTTPKSEYTSLTKVRVRRLVDMLSYNIYFIETY